jgi:hypothetical protein
MNLNVCLGNLKVCDCAKIVRYSDPRFRLSHEWWSCMLDLQGAHVYVKAQSNYLGVLDSFS